MRLCSWSATTRPRCACHRPRVTLRGVVALAAVVAMVPAALARAAAPSTDRSTGTATCSADSASDVHRPNVVLIISDDQAWTDFGFMGHETIRTPHLDRLADQSALLTRGYVPTSLCRASLATIITGLYPHQHRITSNDPPRGTDRRAMLRHLSALGTLPRWLSSAGYLSFQSGKWWEGHHSLGGFTHGMTHGDPAQGGRHGDRGLAIGRQGLEPIFEFIDGCGESPFFVWYAPLLPHDPHTPPERILARYRSAGRPERLAAYWAMCEWFDETCGELLAGLDERGLADDTLVAFVVDNGWIQETGPQRTTRGWFAPRSKSSPYEAGIRTPIMLRWPGRIAPARYEEPVSSIDLAPTILAACGVEVPVELPGIDLLSGSASGADRRRSVQGAIFTHDAVDLDRPGLNLLDRWCVEGHWKLILPHADRAPAELYDLSADPHEQTDLAGEQPQRVAELRALLDQWWSVDECDNPVAAER